MKDRSWILIYILTAIVCAMILSLFLLIYFWIGKPIIGGTTHPPAIAIHQRIVEGGWILTINEIRGGTEATKNPKNILFSLEGSNNSLERGYLESIKLTPSPGYNITWVDEDMDNVVSVGDKILLPKNGGNFGHLEKGFVFKLLFVQTGGTLCEIILE